VKFYISVRAKLYTIKPMLFLPKDNSDTQAVIPTAVYVAHGITITLQAVITRISLPEYFQITSFVSQLCNFSEQCTCFSDSLFILLLVT